MFKKFNKKWKSKTLREKVFVFTLFFLYLFAFQIIVSAYVYKYDYEQYVIVTDQEFVLYSFNNYTTYSSLMVEPVLISVSDWNDRWSFLEDIVNVRLLFLGLLLVFVDSPLFYRKFLLR
jgi:hypothetical protein